MKQVFWSENWALIESGAWLFDTEHNILYYADFDSRTMKCISEIPVIKKEIRQFSYIYATKESVFLFPDFDHRIMVYGIIDGEWSVCEEINNVSNERIRCSSCWRLENQLLIYASYLKQVLVFDLGKKKIVNKISIECEVDEDLWADEVELYERNIYIPSRKSSKVYVLNIDNKKTTVSSIGGTNLSLRTITKANDGLWLSDSIGKLLLVDECSMRLKKEINAEIDEDEENGIKFGFACFLNGKVWFVPSQGSSSVYYIDNGRINKIIIPDEEMKKNEMSKLRYGGRFTVNYIRENRYVGIYSFKTLRTIEIDTLDLKTEAYEYEIVEGVEIVKSVLFDNVLNEMSGFEGRHFLEII